MRRGFIFSLDAAFALVLVSSLYVALLLFSSSTTISQQPVERLGLQAGDAVDVLSYVTVADIRREPAVDSMFTAGVLGQSALNETVTQLVADLWASDDPANLTRAQALTDGLLGGLFPVGSNFAVYASNDSISNRTPVNPRLAVAANRALVSGISSSRKVAEQCVSRVVLQKIRGRSETALVYFGGFDGQGNLTAIVQGVPNGANVSEVYVEANSPANFSVTLNNVPCGLVNSTGSVYGVSRATYVSSNASSCLSAALPGGDNVFYVNFSDGNLSRDYLGGGLIRMTYNTTQLTIPSTTSYRYYFNGVNGALNKFTSFFVPGNVTAMTGHLHIYNNFTTFLIVGNRTVYQDNGTASVRAIDILQSNFTSQFNLSEVSQRTVPVRLGMLANLTGGAGIADVVVITDVSGSMDWRMDTDGSTGTQRACTDPLINDGSTQRLSVAKCRDKEFKDILLSQSGNRIALVSFSTSVGSLNFTTNSSLLNSTIDSFSAGGGTCLACSINEAYNLLNAASNSSRRKYVIVMTDGVANYRATTSCSLSGVDSAPDSDYVCDGAGGYANRIASSNWSLYYSGTIGSNAVSAINSTLAFGAGNSGVFYRWDGVNWTQFQDVGTANLYSIDLLNSTYGLAGANGGLIYSFNGTAWSQQASLGSQTWYGVAVYNTTRALAVGGGSKGYLGNWDGASWTVSQVTGRQFYAVDYVNSTFAFAASDSGKIYYWNGAAWAEYVDLGSQTWYALDVVNPSLAYVAGSGGAMYSWNGTSWASVTSPTTAQINSISFRNSTYGTLVTNDARVYQYDGTSWTLALDLRIQGTDNVGVSCSDPDACSTSFSNNYAAQNANYSACRLYGALSNSTIYSVGYGPVATCSIGNSTMNAIAACGNGSYFASSNASSLEDFYRNLASIIVTQSNASQVVQVVGSANATLYPDSYMDFVYTPSIVQAYGSIALSHSVSLPSCSGTVQLPPSMRMFDAYVTSYSADRWTSNVSVYNGTTWKNAFNLSIYNQTAYTSLGDPYMVYLNASMFSSGNNTVDVRTAFSPQNQTSQCSMDDTLYYRGWVNSSVGYGAPFDTCTARNVSVYYDTNGDNVADGVAYVQVGGSVNETAISASLLNQNRTNAVEDAFARLLAQLDLNNSGGAPGSQANPIDVALSDSVGAAFLPTLGLPNLNMTQVAVVVWR